MDHMFVSGARFKDLQHVDPGSQHIFANILIIDKTRIGNAPLAYQLKDSAAQDLTEGSHRSENLLTSLEDPFILVGEVASVDRAHKKVLLLNGNDISYNYLVIASGNNQGHTSAFAPGLATLSDALKIKKQGLTPPQSSPIGRPFEKEVTSPFSSSAPLDIAQKNISSPPHESTPLASDYHLVFEVLA